MTCWIHKQLKQVGRHPHTYKNSPLCSHKRTFFKGKKYITISAKNINNISNFNTAVLGKRVKKRSVYFLPLKDYARQNKHKFNWLSFLCPNLGLLIGY